MKKNCVFIACSLDGFIADENGGIDWLHSIPNPDGNDMGYVEFMSGIDALLMGRKTFETVCSFGIEWPYSKPVFVLSNTVNELPENLKDKVKILNGDLKSILNEVHSLNLRRLYIDGGTLIQSFLREDLVDEMIITSIPKLLGKGIPLFTEMNRSLDFEGIESKVFLGKIIQNKYIRTRKVQD